MNNSNEAAVIFFRVNGHNHDGENSTKVDFTNYTDEDLAPIIDRFFGRDPELNGGGGGSGTPSSSSGTGLDSIFFHMPGAVGISPTIVAKKKVLYISSSLEVHGTMGASGSTATVITIYKNDDPIGQLTIPANSGVLAPVSILINAAFNGVTDLLSARVTTAGVGAYELGVEVVAIP